MAQVFSRNPDIIHRYPGEKRVQDRLCEVFHNRADVWIRHRPEDLGRKRASFLVLLPRVGILVLVVRDWRVDEIASVSGEQSWTLRGETRVDSHGSPQRNAVAYASAMHRRFRDRRFIVGKDGKPRIPVAGLGVLPHITRAAAAARFGDLAIQDEAFLLEDDLDRLSEALLKTPLRRLHHWKHPVTEADLEALEEQYFTPKMVLASRNRNVECVSLTTFQKPLAAMRDGVGLIQGPPGTGKTLHLVQWVIERARSGRTGERVLLTCYTLTLSRLLRDLVDANVEEPEVRDRIDVLPIFDVFGAVSGTVVKHQGEAGEYYAALPRRALESIANGSWTPRYDAIAVDEGQDFKVPFFQVLTNLLTPESRDLKVAFDPQQNLFAGTDVETVLRQLDPAPSMLFLTTIERSSKPIIDFAYALHGDDKSVAEAVAKGRIVFPARMPGDEASLPEVVEVGTLESAAEWIAASVQEAGKSLPLAEMAILDIQNHSKRTKPWPSLMRERLKALGISATWFTEDTKAKKGFRVTAPSVKIGSVYSAKGLDFERVYLVRLYRPSSAEAEKRQRDVLFVGATRARRKLVFVKVENEE